MTIKALRILPPFAIGRLGSAGEPLDNFTIEDDLDHPLGFRRIKPAKTLVVDDASGEILGTRIPKAMEFKTADQEIRPVAPFVEVFVVTDEDKLEPLTSDLMEQYNATISWRSPPR